MKAHIYVNPKRTVLDPQGQTILRALKKMHYAGIQEVRQGKHFELTLDSAVDAQAARAVCEQVAKEVLTNPVIEEFTLKLEE